MVDQFMMRPKSANRGTMAVIYDDDDDDGDDDDGGGDDDDDNDDDDCGMDLFNSQWICARDPKHPLAQKYIARIPLNRAAPTKVRL